MYYCVLSLSFVLTDALFSLLCEMGKQLHGANRVYQQFEVNPLSGVTSSSQIAVADIGNHASGCAHFVSPKQQEMVLSRNRVPLNPVVHSGHAASEDTPRFGPESPSGWFSIPIWDDLVIFFQ